MALTPLNVVVLGGARSIGVQCARVFTKAGWTCFIADPDSEQLTDIKDELDDKVDVWAGDLNDPLGLRNVLAGALEAFGRVDAVVNIPAAKLPDVEGGGLLDGPADLINNAVLAPARCIPTIYRLFAHQMLRQAKDRAPGSSAALSDSFVHVLGTGALAGDDGKYAQSAWQALVLAAVRAGALELAERRIRTNAVVSVRPRAEIEEPWLKSRTPLGRHSHAEEIADTALYLSGSGAGNMTGQTLVLDGGRNLLNGLIIPPPERD